MYVHTYTKLNTAAWLKSTPINHLLALRAVRKYCMYVTSATIVRCSWSCDSIISEMKKSPMVVCVCVYVLGERGESDMHHVTCSLYKGTYVRTYIGG